MIRGLDRGEVYPKFAFLQMRWRREIFLDNLDLTMLATSTMVNNGSKFSRMIKSIEQAYLEVALFFDNN